MHKILNLLITKPVQSNDILGITSLNKKVIKKGEKTQKDLKSGKLMPRQAATLDKNEANIAKDLTTANKTVK